MLAQRSKPDIRQRFVSICPGPLTNLQPSQYNFLCISIEKWDGDTFSATY